jgi:hypothetical protein
VIVLPARESHPCDGLCGKLSFSGQSRVLSVGPDKPLSKLGPDIIKLEQYKQKLGLMAVGGPHEEVQLCPGKPNCLHQVPVLRLVHF